MPHGRAEGKYLICIDGDAIDKALNAAEAKGLLYRDHQIIRPTQLGQHFLNDLQQMFLED